MLSKEAFSRKPLGLCGESRPCFAISARFLGPGAGGFWRAASRAKLAVHLRGGQLFAFGGRSRRDALDPLSGSCTKKAPAQHEPRVHGFTGGPRSHTESRWAESAWLKKLPFRTAAAAPCVLGSTSLTRLLLLWGVREEVPLLSPSRLASCCVVSVAHWCSSLRTEALSLLL